MEELAAIAAVVAVAQKLYSAYQFVANLLSPGGPTPEDEILAQLQQVAEQLAGLQTALNTLNTAVKALIAEAELIAFDDMVTNVAALTAQAQTAAEELQQWVEGGKADALILADAENNSLTAANVMLNTTTFFELPIADPTTGDAGNVFDYRVALVQYLYILTVRRSVIQISEPDWISDPAILQELQDHATRLTGIISQMDAAILDHPIETVGGGEYRVANYCGDTISGYQTQFVDELGQDAYVYSGNDVPGTQEDADLALEQLKAPQRAEVRDAIGMTAVMQFRDGVSYDAAKQQADWTPWFTVAPTIGADSSIANPGIGFTFPMAVTADTAGTIYLFWIAPNGAIWSTILDSTAAAPTWGTPVQITGPRAALFIGALSAVSSGPGSVSVLWVAPDYSIQTTYYDTREASPEWAAPITLAAPAAGEYYDSLCIVSSAPYTINAFWRSGVEAKIMTVSYVLSAVPLFSPGQGLRMFVIATGLTSPVTVAENAGSQASVVSSGPGNISVVFPALTDKSLQLTYYDTRATNPAWSEPLTILPSGGAYIEWGSGIAASSSPYNVDLMWIRSILDPTADPSTWTVDLSIWTGSYEFVVREFAVGSKGSPILKLTTDVLVSPLNSRSQIAPNGSTYIPALQLAFANTAPIGTLLSVGQQIRPGAATVAWLGPDLSVRVTYRPSSTGPWAPWTGIGAPIGEAAGPPIAIAPTEGVIYIFIHVSDGTIQCTYHQPALPLLEPPPALELAVEPEPEERGKIPDATRQSQSQQSDDAKTRGRPKRAAAPARRPQRTTRKP